MVRDTARRNLLAHIEGERRNDIEAIMAPLSIAQLCDARLCAGDPGDVRIRHAPSRGSQHDEYRRGLDDPAVTRWAEDHCVLEYTDDYPLHRNMAVIVHFDPDGRIRSENIYWRGDRPASPKGEDFLALPGVTPNKLILSF